MLGGITEWILSLGGWIAIAVVFLVPALEASVFLGFVFPGEIAVLLGGVLASDGRVPLTGVIVAAIAGAVIGDMIGYFVGRRWGHQILRGIGRRMPFIRHRIDDHLERARSLLQRRGGTAVFLGRFTAALRVMVPGLAGMAELPYPTFALFNVAGGVLWATGVVLIGYFAGTAWEHAAREMSWAGAALLVIVVLALVGGKLVRDRRERGASHR
jgi:undecaprenyl-diphosphatase